jgi:type I restriction enzyme M protein
LESNIPKNDLNHFTFEKLKGDPHNIAANLTQYIRSFSAKARDIIENFDFEDHIPKLDQHNRLLTFQIVSSKCKYETK